MTAFSLHDFFDVLYSDKHLNFYESIIRDGDRNTLFSTSSCTILLYYFNYNVMNIRNLERHIKVPGRIINLVSLKFKFHTLDATNRPSNTMTLYVFAAPSPPNLPT